MTSLELLERAAKAAGVQYDPEASRPHPKSGAWFGLWLTFDREPTEYDRRRWNPIVDDGDALRLSAELSIDVLHRFIGGQRVEALAPGGAVKVEYCDTETRRAATRIAIVRAAAALADNEQGQGRADSVAGRPSPAPDC